MSRGSIDNKSELYTSSHGNKNGLEGMLSARTNEIKSADPRLSQALNQISARTFQAFLSRRY
jgi:phage tail sheath gpL-like